MVNPFTPQAPQDAPRGQWVDGGKILTGYRQFLSNLRLKFI